MARRQAASPKPVDTTEVADAPPSALMTKGDFAARHKVEPSQVTRWMKEGLPVTGKGHAGRVLIKEGDDWVAARVPYARGTKHAGDNGLNQRLAEIRVRVAELDLAKAEREQAKAEGMLVERSAMEQAIAGVFGEIRRGLMGLPLAVAPEIAAQSGTEAAVVRIALEREMRQVLGAIDKALSAL